MSNIIQIESDEYKATRGLILAISSPSGSGKTTVCKELLQRDASLRLSVSATTRNPRKGEVNGKDYWFLSEGDFLKRKNESRFLEFAKVFDNHYGTLLSEVDVMLEKGLDCLLDVDWQGVRQIQKKRSKELVSIFILPPSANELERRLKMRALDSNSTINRRMQGALREVEHWVEYDYVLVNSVIEETVSIIMSILAAERRRLHRSLGLSSFVDMLSTDLSSFSN